MRRLGWLAVGLLFAASAGAQDQFLYPNKGQSAAQQEKDKYQCYEWAKGQTGFDPMATPTTKTPRPQGGHSSLLGGAVRGAGAGAAVGAVGGAVAGHKAGKGAKIGAASGGLLGTMVAAGGNAEASRKQREWERGEANAYAASRSQYDRASAACMEGRGYTVK